MHNSTLNLLKKFRILIVEDDPIALEMISFGLKEHFGKLYVAKDGLEGFEIFKKHNVDMILTDIHMPNLNGLEMIKLILQIKPNQNFIVMTSYDSDKNLLDSIKCGALNFIPKPLDIPTLQRFLLLSLTNLKDELKQISPRVSVNFINEAIFLDNKPIFLSAKNHKIFWLLVYNLDKIVSYEVIEDYIYDGENFSKSALYMSIKRLKYELNDLNIENIHSSGYILKASI